MDLIYSLTLLVSLVSGSMAVLGAIALAVRAGQGLARIRYVRWAVCVAVLAGLTSFLVHLWWGHTPGSPAALSLWQFVHAHVSFVAAAVLPGIAVVLILWSGAWKR